MIQGGAPVQTWRKHRCSREHHTFAAFIRCAIPRAAWVVGEGPFALVAWCRTPSVTLHEDLGSARQAKAGIDATGCGGSCSGNHDIVRIEMPQRR
jgi:hypothetical protein